MTDTTPEICNEKPALFWILFFVFLAVMAWFARYYLSPGFGLYEDDLAFIPSAMEADFSGIVHMISGYFSSLAQQGRPFMWSWVVFFSHIGWRLGGLQAMYAIAYMVWLTNIVLFILLLKKINTSFFFCVVGGIAYVLFSADTNQAFLFNAFGLQTAITFLLLALHLYLSYQKWRWGSYILMIIVILTYETPYWLFLAAPLLTEFKGKVMVRRLVENTLTMALIFIAVYFLRYISGEARVAAIGFPEMIVTPIRHMAIGPFVSLGIYFLRPILVLRNFTVILGTASLLGAGSLFAILYWVQRSEKVTAINLTVFPINKGWWAGLDTQVQREFRLVLAGLVMLVFAYPLTILLRSYAISGRETRVHLAAVVGVSLIIPGVVSLLFRIFKEKKIRLVLLVLMSLVFGFNFAFGFIIQKAYVRAWDLQKAFWQELLPLIADVEDGTAVLVEPSGIEDVLYIDANTWVLPRMLSRLYVQPDEWDRIPSVFRLVKFWEENIVRVPGYFSIDGTNSVAHLVSFGDYAHDNSIYITTFSGKLVRHSEMIFTDEIISLKPVGPDVLSTLETRPLYDLMILSE